MYSPCGAPWFHLFSAAVPHGVLVVVDPSKTPHGCGQTSQRPASATARSSLLSRNEASVPPCASLLYECPVSNPSTNQANSAAPIANRMSPGTLIQRRVCMELDCMNSEERAYQVLCSMDAQACSSPTGSMLRITMKIKPKFRDQKESFSGASFHLRPGFSARRQNSVRPRPNIPYTPNKAV